MAKDPTKTPMEVPDFFYGIPDDADEQTKLYMRASLIIQGAFHTFGDAELKPGTRTIGRSDLESAIALALAMLMTTDDQIKTKQQVRKQADVIAKYIADMTNAIRENGDSGPSALLAALNLSVSRPN